MTYRIRLLETEEGWAVSCLDMGAIAGDAGPTPQEFRELL